MRIGVVRQLAAERHTGALRRRDVAAIHELQDGMDILVTAGGGQVAGNGADADDAEEWGFQGGDDRQRVIHPRISIDEHGDGVVADCLGSRHGLAFAAWLRHRKATLSIVTLAAGKFKASAGAKRGCRSAFPHHHRRFAGRRWARMTSCRRDHAPHIQNWICVRSWAAAGAKLMLTSNSSMTLRMILRGDIGFSPLLTNEISAQRKRTTLQNTLGCAAYTCHPSFCLSVRLAVRQQIRQDELP